MIKKIARALLSRLVQVTSNYLYPLYFGKLNVTAEYDVKSIEESIIMFNRHRGSTEIIPVSKYYPDNIRLCINRITIHEQLHGDFAQSLTWEYYIKHYVEDTNNHGLSNALTSKNYKLEHSIHLSPEGLMSPSGAPYPAEEGMGLLIEKCKVKCSLMSFYRSLEQKGTRDIFLRKPILLESNKQSKRARIKDITHQVDEILIKDYLYEHTEYYKLLDKIEFNLANEHVVFEDHTKVNVTLDNWQINYSVKALEAFITSHHINEPCYIYSGESLYWCATLFIVALKHNKPLLILNNEQQYDRLSTDHNISSCGYFVDRQEGEACCSNWDGGAPLSYIKVSNSLIKPNDNDGLKGISFISESDVLTSFSSQEIALVYYEFELLAQIPKNKKILSTIDIKQPIGFALTTIGALSDQKKTCYCPYHALRQTFGFGNSILIITPKSLSLLAKLESRRELKYATQVIALIDNTSDIERIRERCKEHRIRVQLGYIDSAKGCLLSLQRLGQCNKVGLGTSLRSIRLNQASWKWKYKWDAEWSEINNDFDFNLVEESK